VAGRSSLRLRSARAERGALEARLVLDGVGQLTALGQLDDLTLEWIEPLSALRRYHHPRPQTITNWLRASR
jgi:hypothetical protein